jgi:GalNAc-alpha-(1->4)-GalNAc-alpha-(1->3)-diNAcBac-PP-undecaprenol alpha-1,4-N-acetyl-D-galactosaminyltransferase
MNKGSQKDFNHGVTLIIPSLRCGGAERVLKTMAEYWARRGRSVTLITLYTRDLDFYSLSPEVTRIDLGLENTNMSSLNLALGAFKSFVKLRNAIKEAGDPIVISFVSRTNLLTLLATRFMRIGVIVSEHTDPAMRSLGVIPETLRRWLYPKAAKVTVLTKNVKREWAEKFLLPEKVRVMPNPVSAFKEESSAIAIELPARYIVTVGRLIPEKGHEDLLKAFNLIANRFPDISLLIVGEGPERAALEKSIAELKMGGRVCLTGLLSHLGPIIGKADCFVFPSRREGFGMALVEAMNCGAPCISFDCPSGPGEIIQASVNGILVPPGDIEGLAGAMAKLLDDPEERRRIGRNATKSIKERFSVDRIMLQWDALLRECITDQSA